MKISVRSIAFFPLRAIGLDPGRALINAHPSEADKNRDRVEMRRYILGAISARGGDGESPVASGDQGSAQRSAALMTSQLGYTDSRIDRS